MESVVKHIKLLLLGTILSLSTGTFGQNLLNQIVSLDNTNTNIETVLEELEEKGNFRFAYNSNLFDPKATVTLQGGNLTVGDVLSQLFGDRIVTKNRGKYIVLFPSGSARKSDLNQVTLKGNVLDGKTGKAIPSATVYEVRNLKSAQTSSSGGFDLALKTQNEELQIAISRENYRDTIINVSRLSPNFNVTLYPDENSKSGQSSLDSISILKLLINEQNLQILNNVDILENRFFQVSFLPLLGSNRLLKGNTSNNLSINIIAGVTQQVSGFEMAGVFNIVRKDLLGLQIGGFGNFVAGKIRGVQLGGFGNHGQILSGIQMGGFLNRSVFMNGLQMSGFLNSAIQSKGVQIAGAINQTQELKWTQIAGAINQSEQSNGVQIAGFYNRSKSIKGFQLAGFMNMAKELKGVQLAGFLNISEKVNGLQIAPLNICDTIEKGAVVGLFNWVKRGVPHFEIESNDMFHTQLNIKSGNDHFYQFTSAGMRMNGQASRWGFGLGIGTLKNIGKRAYLNMELLGMANNGVRKFDFESGVSADLRLGFGMKFKGNRSLNIGPIIHTYFTNGESNSELSQSISDVSIDTQPNELNHWLGYRLGLWF